MDENLAARILRLPAPILGELSVVPGPGWYLRGRVVEGAPCAPKLRAKVPRLLLAGGAWWSANPARSVAAVTSMPSWWAHQRIADWLYDREPDADDHAAAISIIEAHVAGSTP